MNYKIITLKSFEKDAKQLFKKYPSISSDLRTLFEELILEPTQGIPLGRDCYKIRLAIASKGKGKSGGARIFTCVKIVHTTIYLHTIIEKSEDENITDNELLKLLSQIDN